MQPFGQVVGKSIERGRAVPGAEGAANAGGGGGAPFNFGEATVTRATVRLENGAVTGRAALLIG